MKQRNGGLSAVELLIALALSSALLWAIVNGYVRIKVATLEDEQLTEASHDSRWLAFAITDNLKSAATIAYVASEDLEPSLNPCDWLEHARMPFTVYGTDESNNAIVGACLPNGVQRKDDIILLARDGNLIVGDGVGGIDVYSLEKRADSSDYGCDTEREVFSLLRRRYRPDKQVYSEELLPGVRRWRIAYATMDQPPSTDVRFVTASQITDWRAVRAVRLDVEIAPVCAPVHRAEGMPTGFAWIQTVALGQFPAIPR